MDDNDKDYNTGPFLYGFGMGVLLGLFFGAILWFGGFGDADAPEKKVDIGYIEELKD